MVQIAPIKVIGLTKMNNAEYGNFMGRFRQLISDATPASDSAGEEKDIAKEAEILGIPPEDLTQFTADCELLSDLVNKSQISDETSEMAIVDKERDEYTVFTTSTSSQMSKSPIAAQRTAGKTVYNILKPYVGLYRLAKQQKTAQIEGMLLDLSKPSMPELLETLALTEVVAKLRIANTKYANLTALRTNKRAASVQENSTKVRMRMDGLYHNMTTLIFVKSVATPSDACNQFVSNLNALIDETSALYNQRIALLRAAKKPIKEKRLD